MKASEIRTWDTTKINDEITELKKELFDLRFQQATGQLENTARVGKVKKAIARMKTVLNERNE
ncbi:50S ribosomal protein L29 [Candidatus Xianfuyuplasma coldseepsis]|uniref:Large ribosomal subunit protein uL29 n=1 Tax=Candidatus Xianfuyuplasma coldseepsis TaxID=2782163 RepID=A0A7L7KR68_9MOLU|nr:50S ribosomal protein L29 [Xianfuyuplasma coldseepsis]QMS85187.1 50S ribosomal protein L29 [Xianfuyuplasma coldseepsis]